MLRNYFKIAIRNLLKYKFVSFVNLFGLTVGLTCCLLILSYILQEVSYDRFQPEADRVYRVERTFRNVQTGVVSLNLGTVAPPVGPLLQNDFQEVESMTRILPNDNVALLYEDKMFNERNGYFADSNFFDFFKTDVVQGNARRALSEPFSIMLTEELARKYFGKEDPINKVLRVSMGDYFDFKVTGVFKPFPTNTHFHPELMFSFNTLKDPKIYGDSILRNNYGNNSFLTYIRLPKNYDPKRLEAQFPGFLNRHVVADKGGFKPSQWTSLSLRKLTDIHLRSHTDLEAEENGDIRRVYIFSAVALFILLIACINYMNLSTARSTLRAREIGIRKVSGAQRKEIIFQFLSESVLIAWIAFILAAGLTWLLAPALNKLSGQQLDLSVLLRPQVLVPVLLVPFIVGILSGLYPAAFMSSFRPVKVLKGFLKTGGGLSFRKVLVTVQFAISIILIICTVIVFDQMRFLQNKSLGFDKDHIVTLPYVTALNERYDGFRNELLSNPDIKNAGRSSRIPTGRLLDASSAKMLTGDSMMRVNADIKMVSADPDFMSTYGVKLVAGHGFTGDFSRDTSYFLINEAAARVLGFKTNEAALERGFGYGKRRGKLVGVFHDFHFESMHQKIIPLVLLVPKTADFYGNLSVKMGGANTPATLAFIEKTWKKFLPETPFRYTFLDDNFAKLYEAESRQRSLFTLFSCLAIFIACLGLFGLSAFTISQRMREIGIRKVLGAEVGSIVTLLSKDFLKLVLLAAVLAFPVAWYAMSSWLQDFAYRIDIPLWAFVFAGILAALIAFFTIGIQAFRAAVANPVKNLRTE